MTDGAQRFRLEGGRTRTTIVLAAARLATVDGLDGLSIANLAACTGMSKSGLYAHFGSKEELQLATIELAREIFDADVVEPTDAIADPLRRIQALCDSFLSHLARRVFPGGCFFASVGAEFDTRPGPVKDLVARTRAEWSARLERLLAELRSLGRLRANVDPAQLTFELEAFMLMGNTNFLLYDEPSYLDRAGSAVRRHLERATSHG